jgi:asparagine synthase (glutamine-hydrolysing)
MTALRKKNVRATGGDEGPISGITADDRELISRVRSEKLTYLSDQKMFCLLDTCRSIEIANLPGVFIEAGCALCGSAILIAKTKKYERPFFVCDVFEMIPPATEKDSQDVHDRYKIITDGKSVVIGGDKYYGCQKNLYDIVQSNFRKF